MLFWPSLGYALVGALLAALLTPIPALHVYNVAGLLLLAYDGLRPLLPPEGLALLLMGMVTGYAMLNAIPAIFFTAPDESVLFVVLPGQKYLLQRRGYEAVLLTGLGGLGGVMVLVALAPVAPSLFPTLRAILQPHLPWILVAITAYMLLSEWPKGTDRARTSWGKLAEAWRSLGAGLLTFLLSGLLGIILFRRNLVPVTVAYQGLLPAFLGLFAIPWLLQNILARTELPSQHIASSVDLSLPLLLRGVAAGALGGFLAAFFPVITGGIGGFLAGHATAQRDDRLFLLSQGASRVVYYVGGFLLFFVPGLHLTRGGMAWMVSPLYRPGGPEALYQATAALLAAGLFAFFLLSPLTRLALGLVGRLGYRTTSMVSLSLVLALILGLTGPGGLLIAAVATGIGLIPVLWGSRRMNGLGLLLVPVTLNMLGVGSQVASWLGL